MATDFAADGWTNETSSDDVHLAEHQLVASTINDIEDALAAAEAVSVQADITGGEPPTQAEFNALLASVRAIQAALTP